MDQNNLAKILKDYVKRENILLVNIHKINNMLCVLLKFYEKLHILLT